MSEAILGGRGEITPGDRMTENRRQMTEDRRQVLLGTMHYALGTKSHGVRCQGGEKQKLKPET
jgi:hypothetical protein